ncbi:MAG: glycosyltransferase family 4 protein [Planctomycetaceae bacterium]
MLRVAFLAHTPPPVMGPAILGRLALEAPPADLELIHFELSDRRPRATLGKCDIGNVLFALLAYPRLFLLLLRRRPHLLYLPLSQTRLGFLRDSGFLLLARLFRVPVLLHLHGGGFRAFYRAAGLALQGWIRALVGRAAGAIVLGENLRAQFQELLPQDRILVLPNGVAGPRPPFAHRGGGGLLFLANARPGRGDDVLRRALPLLQAPVVLAGEGMERGPVGAEERDALLASADLFVFPAVAEEGQPLAILEAMAVGLPIVATDTGSVGECVREGVNGRIVPKGDPVALAAACNALLRDRPERARMGRESVRIWRERHTAERFREGLFAAMRSAARTGGR